MLRRVVVDDIEVTVDVAGEGPVAIVLLHGLGGTHETWTTVLPALANGARVFAPDLRGCGETSRGIATWTLARVAEDIRPLARTLD
jgi:pimeloyl-ACP methyl ester carboxylesterase